MGDKACIFIQASLQEVLDLAGSAHAANADLLEKYEGWALVLEGAKLYLKGSGDLKEGPLCGVTLSDLQRLKWGTLSDVAVSDILKSLNVWAWGHLASGGGGKPSGDAPLSVKKPFKFGKGQLKAPRMKAKPGSGIVSLTAAHLLEPALPLSKADVVGHRVLGTSSGSVYRALALGRLGNLGARWSGGKLSMRFEPKKTPPPSVKSVLDSLMVFKESGTLEFGYWSQHFLSMTSFSLVNKTVGAVALALGIPWSDLVSDPAKFLKEAHDVGG